jgi:hypothetical protein
MRRQNSWTDPTIIGERRETLSFHEPGINSISGNEVVCAFPSSEPELGSSVARRGWHRQVSSARGTPDRTQPARLQALGCIVEKTGETQRILPHAVRQDMTISSSGALVAATEGSTRPVTVSITNAGVAVVDQFDLRMS